MDEQLFNLLVSTLTRFNKNTIDALRDVKVHGLSQSKAARKYNVSRQFISVKIKRLNEIEEEFFSNTKKYDIYLVKKK